METIKIGSWKGCPNAGFVRRLILIPSQDVIDLPDPALLFDHDDTQTLPIESVAFNPYAQTIIFDFEYKTCTYSLNQNQSTDGPLYAISIQGTVPLLLAGINKELEKRRGYRWIAFFQDHNHNVYIAGTPDYPLTLSYVQSITDKTSSTVFLSGRTPQPPYNTNALPSPLRYFSSAFERTFS
ncbi:hypothetical protein [Runella sp.]|uniref:hypothetical protein n=1 Tax=Runella sp. TaxID=1960881 RepID=UPI003D0DE232